MSSPGDWMCPACQHINFKKRESCQKCNCPKFATASDIAAYGSSRTQVLAGDWYCGTMNCGAHNYASRTSCYRCGTFKYDYCGYGSNMVAPGAHVYDASTLPGWKAGDWICSRYGCGTHNYACREYCYKCNSPRDYGGAV